jgi:signal peptidase I
MKKKDFRHLSRADLIDIIIKQDQEAAEKSGAGGVDPSVLEEAKAEQERSRHKSRFRRTLASTVGALLVVAAIAILISTLWMPVLQIYGSSMTPAFEDGDIVVLNKTSDIEMGDIIAFYYNNKILVKQVIAKGGDWIDIDDEGNVSVNGTVLDEPYVTDKSLGECDLTFPYQVPEESYFVMGDHRSVSIDSRSTQVGPVRQDEIIGHVIFRIWPFKRIDWMPGDSVVSSS